MDQNSAACSRMVGRTVLWVGAEAFHMDRAAIQAAAEFARSLGIDTLSVKRADGTNKWYGDAAGLAAERAAVNAAGCGYLPFSYSYGPKFGIVAGECAILAEMMEVNNGAVMCDMEAEWNGQLVAAEEFERLMRPVQGLLYITTWADPQQQAWGGVTQALAPCVNAWVPQQYNNWLAGQEQQLVSLGESCLQPGVDLSQEFGANNALGIVQQAIRNGQGTVWLWEIGFARGNPQLVREIVAAMSAVSIPGAPTPAPVPVPVVTPPPASAPSEYTVVEGDSLSLIAERHNVSLSALEAANPQITDFNLIYPGQIIHIP